MFPDHFVHVRRRRQPRGRSSGRSFDLRPGRHRGLRAPGGRHARAAGARTPTGPDRVDDHHLLVHDTSLRALVERAGVKLIGYRELRDLQRAG